MVHCISLRALSFTASQHKRGSKRCRRMEKGKRNSFSTAGLFCAHLPPTPVTQCWQSRAASCCEGLRLPSSLFPRQRGAAALHISWECLWIHNISPRRALPACPSTVTYGHQACPVLASAKLQPAFGKRRSSPPLLSSLGSLERRCKGKALSALLGTGTFARGFVISHGVGVSYVHCHLVFTSEICFSWSHVVLRESECPRGEAERARRGSELQTLVSAKQSLRTGKYRSG